MNIRKYKNKYLNKKLLKYPNCWLIFRDVLNIKNPINSNEFHLINGINWIIFAQKTTKDGGVSNGFSLISGWQPSYPETSGYIIPTLLNYYN